MARSSPILRLWGNRRQRPGLNGWSWLDYHPSVETDVVIVRVHFFERFETFQWIEFIALNFGAMFCSISLKEMHMKPATLMVNVQQGRGHAVPGLRAEERTKRLCRLKAVPQGHGLGGTGSYDGQVAIATGVMVSHCVSTSIDRYESSGEALMGDFDAEVLTIVGIDLAEDGLPARSTASLLKPSSSSRARRAFEQIGARRTVRNHEGLYPMYSRLCSAQ